MVFEHVGSIPVVALRPVRRWYSQGMPHAVSDNRNVSDLIRQAFTTRDLSAFGALLNDDVSWGDVGDPMGCRNRSDVLAAFGQLLQKGVEGTIAELVPGTAGILCELRLKWPKNDPRAWDRSLFHVYLVNGGLIYNIQRHDDRDSAAEAAGLAR